MPEGRFKCSLGDPGANGLPGAGAAGKTMKMATTTKMDFLSEQVVATPFSRRDKEDEEIKKAKKLGAVKCKDCNGLICEKECFIDPVSGKYFHLTCAPAVPNLLVGKRIRALLRVASPGKHKKRDNSYWRIGHLLRGRDEDNWDD